jgi:hypothetical protein
MTSANVRKGLQESDKPVYDEKCGLFTLGSIAQQVQNGVFAIKTSDLNTSPR